MKIRSFDALGANSASSPRSHTKWELSAAVETVVRIPRLDRGVVRIPQFAAHAAVHVESVVASAFVVAEVVGAEGAETPLQNGVFQDLQSTGNNACVEV